MILMVRVFDCVLEMSSKIDQETKSKPDLHVWSILDWVLVAFGEEFGPKSIQKRCWKAMRKK